MMDVILANIVVSPTHRVQWAAQDWSVSVAVGAARTTADHSVSASLLSINNKVKAALINNKINVYSSKPLHGQFFQQT